MPSALRFEPCAGPVWRCTEAQFRSATVRITDTNAEQALLEDILEDTKPPMTPACRHLHYAFAAAFRYGAYPRDSRFRRRGRTPGVYYASEHMLSAISETIWYRWAFFAASPETPLPRQPVEHTGICADISVAAGHDLTQDADPRWTDPDDYSACLARADQVRAQGGGLIRYASVRDPDARANVAVLTCAGFAETRPNGLQGWKILFTATTARAFCDTTRENYEMHRSGTRLAWGLG